MKRSEINAIIAKTKELIIENKVTLPPFAYWSTAVWDAKGLEVCEIKDCGLGWDVTDFGSEDFLKIGLTVFTIRNGHRDIEKYAGKTYCEKLLIVEENQVTPMHYHVFKSEDIICKGGGNLVVEVYNKVDDGEALADTDVDVVLDGVAHIVSAGHKFVMTPGQSITLTPLMYHAFWAEEGTGTSIVGEVSKVNDDSNDNFFLDGGVRFPAIEEDEDREHYLCSEYSDKS